MTRISRPHLSHLQRKILIDKNKKLMSQLQDILNSHLPQGVQLTGDINASVLKAMKAIADMKNIDDSYTHLSICLDRSGSMQSIREDIIGGFNAFINSQKELPGKLTVSLIQFDNYYEQIYTFVDGKEVIDLTKESFIPRGGTALNDSFYRLIEETKQYIDNMPGNKPGRVLFLSLTDGEENASAQRSTTDLKQFIKQCEQDYKWTFSYIGAEQDAFIEGEARGISFKNSYTFDKSKAGVDMMFQNLTRSSSLYRTASSVDLANEVYNLSDDTKNNIQP